MELVCPADKSNEAEQVMIEIERRAVDLDGTITGEHGIGYKLRDRVIYELGREHDRHDAQGKQPAISQDR